jgi:hypothetical protein
VKAEVEVEGEGEGECMEGCPTPHRQRRTSIGNRVSGVRPPYP